MKFLNSHIKIIMRTATIGCLLLLSIVMLKKVENIRIGYEEQQQQIADELDDSQIFTVSVNLSRKKAITSGAETTVNWWYNEKDGKYYLFLPSYADLNALKVQMSIVNEILIDGKKVNNGDICSLQAGSHEITTLVNDQVFPLEIMKSANTAAFFFDTDSGSLQYLHTDKANEEGGKLAIIKQDGKTEFTGEIEAMHCRGNASWEETDKKSYQIKLPREANLLGMGDSKKWLLIANAFDSTLIRNLTTFDMAHEIGLAYTPEMESVDVYANGNYVGNYLLSTKVEVGENRVNVKDLEAETKKKNTEIKDLSTCDTFMTPQGRLFSTKGYEIPEEPEDLTGGYLLEIEMSDRYGLEASGFITSRMQPVVFSSPKYASYQQVSYIANRYQDLEDAMFSEDGYSPYTGSYYGDYIDIDSFARKYLLEEIVKNLDAAFTSQYFYKPNDSISTKFFAGPAWDYDKAIAGSGITQEGIDLFDPVGFYACVKTKDSDIWYALYQQEEFRNTAIQIYFDEFKAIAEKEADTKIDDRADRILDAAMMNAFRWDTFSEDITIEEKTNTFYEKVAELTNFLHERNKFLSEEWNK